MQNHLKDQTSPYLLQHMNNPVDWYPWSEEAFQRAEHEDKPIFLSIGYSTCHWCHVMAHESFEDVEIAEILNQYFVSIKVDKEERPDIDSIYMSVCQALSGSGGWPTTIFMTPEQKPFFAGTYFPKTSRYGRIGLKELLLAVHEKWVNDRSSLLESAENILLLVERTYTRTGQSPQGSLEETGLQLADAAVQIFKGTFDEQWGGFGDAPKFPSPHNLLFLMRYYQKSREEAALHMVEKTLLQMYRGGIFDHIGGGFSRYSADRYFLIPHFEKMLYDNAMLILAYCKAFQLTQNELYRGVAEKTAGYIQKEMTSPEGGFYSAQDADSEGVEGKYYLFEPLEILKLLGRKTGKDFCSYFDITCQGNFEGKNVPNLLRSTYLCTRYQEKLPKLYEYRRKRCSLHLDDKILTSWNGLMIAAMCHLYRITGTEEYLRLAKEAQEFLEKNLFVSDPAGEVELYVSWRKGLQSTSGFLDDYANEIYALLALYEAALDKEYLEKAQRLCRKAIADFYDKEKGGFFLSSEKNEALFLRPKETHDGAVPSGNSMMAYNLVWLSYLTEEKQYQEFAVKQLEYMAQEAESYPVGYAMYLMALEEYLEMPDKITIVVKNKEDLKGLACRIPLDTIVRLLEEPTQEYPLKDNRTTFYVCRGKSCQPASNILEI